MTTTADLRACADGIENGVGKALDHALHLAPDLMREAADALDQRARRPYAIEDDAGFRCTGLSRNVWKINRQGQWGEVHQQQWQRPVYDPVKNEITGAQETQWRDVPLVFEEES